MMNWMKSRMYTSKATLPWVLWKRVFGCEALFISMTTRPAIKRPIATTFKPECMYVPCTFCFCVDVGWRSRIDWTSTSMPAEFKSWYSVNKWNSYFSTSRNTPDDRRRMKNQLQRQPPKPMLLESMLLLGLLSLCLHKTVNTRLHFMP